MSDWIQTYDAVFFVTISTLICGSFGLVVRYCLKSKCDEVNLCYGLIKVHRDIKSEIELEEKEIEAGLDDDSDKTKN
jgi:hypothetical protein